MFTSVLDLFSIGIGPSSSHTMGPMLAALRFINMASDFLTLNPTSDELSIRCTLKGSLAFTGRGHRTDWGVTFGLHGYSAEEVSRLNVDEVYEKLVDAGGIPLKGATLRFSPQTDIIFDTSETLPEHPNGMLYELLGQSGEVLLSETCFSVGGGFIQSADEWRNEQNPAAPSASTPCPYDFETAAEMLIMSNEHGMTIAEMKRANELAVHSEEELDRKLDALWTAMKMCVENGLQASGILPGGLDVPRRAGKLHEDLIKDPLQANITDWLCAYAMAVNEENAAGHLVVTAPTNGAAGVIPAVLYNHVMNEGGTDESARDFLLVAGAIGSLVKQHSSISGAEVGCQGEVGSASAMAAAGICALRGGSTEQVENAAEIALEHHLGMTCDPVKGLVQVPCIERNGFGAIKAHAAASLALRGDGQHFMPLDNCIAAMQEIGEDMSRKFKETSLGGLAVNYAEC